MSVVSPGTWDGIHAELADMDAVDLAGTDLMQRGAIHTLESLLRSGVTQANVEQMLRDVKVLRGCVQATAALRGIALPAE